METGTSIILYQAPIKMKNNFQKTLREITPYLVSIEIDGETLLFYLKCLIPLNWQLKKDNHTVIDKINQTLEANVLTIKSSSEEVTIDYLLQYLKDNITQNKKREDIEKKVEEKRLKEQMLLEEKLNKLKNKSLKIKETDEFIEFETSNIQPTYQEPVNIDNGINVDVNNPHLQVPRTNGYRPNPNISFSEPDPEVQAVQEMSNEEYYGISNIQVRDMNELKVDDYFTQKRGEKPIPSKDLEMFNKFGISLDFEREEE